MHTFEVSACISPSAYRYLHDNLPSMEQVSQYVERSNFYAGKGITQIELRTHEYPKHGLMMKRFYLVLRCNPSIIMGDSKTLLIDLEKYSSDEIMERLQKRLYEINEFRYLKLHETPITLFRANRVDIAEDVVVAFPQLLVWLCNMRFPYKHCNMKRIDFQKESNSRMESCYFTNSRTRKVNIYHKLIAMLGKPILTDEMERIQHTVRVEVQIQKKGIYNMKLKSKRSIKPFLERDFCHEYLVREMRSIFGIEPFLSKSKAVETIQNSQHKAYDKAVMLSIVDSIERFNGLYELEKAIDDESVNTPLQYGNLRTFKSKWLGKFKAIGIQPVVIPDDFSIDEFPSITTLLLNLNGGHNHVNYEENQH